MMGATLEVVSILRPHEKMDATFEVVPILMM
jgi:hypothetical protein